MRAIMVCVDYSDFLSITLPANRHHFDDMMIVTDRRDEETCAVAYTQNCGMPVQVYRTNAFYEDGAQFNKWRALEEALEQFGREGWMCIMDADVLWPQRLPQEFYSSLRIGKLYTPLRRMFTDLSQPIPQESEWQRYPIHRNIAEWAGYSQIFHASDPVLGEPPWHEIDWLHAGGADSMFQLKWKPADKIRPPFEVLHLGEAGVNWCGRASRYLDGSQPENAEEKRQQLRTYIAGRRTGVHRFAGEKIRR